jgi:hypothetical protein
VTIHAATVEYILAHRAVIGPIVMVLITSGSVAIFAWGIAIALRDCLNARMKYVDWRDARKAAIRSTGTDGAPRFYSVNSIAAGSFADLLDKNHKAVGDAAAKAVAGGHGRLNTEIQRISRDAA